MNQEVIYRPERPAPDPIRLQEELKRLSGLLNRLQLSTWSEKKSRVLFLDFDGPSPSRGPFTRTPGLRSQR